MRNHARPLAKDQLSLRTTGIALSSACPLLAIATVALILLAGCVDTTSVRSDTAATGKVTVVGRLQVLHEGEDHKWNLFQSGRIFVARDGKGQAITQEVMRSDGMFFLTLEPGQYMFVGAAFSNPKSWTEGQMARRVRVGALFTVPEGIESVYVGTVRIEAVQGGYRDSVDNDYATAAAAYRDKFPGAGNPVVALMQPETPVGTYDLMQNACSADWGVDCSGKFAGVTPSYPPVETNNFPVVTSLQPTFRWEPSSKDGVLYDLILYRVVSHSPFGIGGILLPGQVVDYQQGLAAPSYRPSTQLEPGEKYFWSVRLRRDGTVSNWSRFSFFNFMLVAWTSGHSSWFGFATPDVE